MALSRSTPLTGPTSLTLEEVADFWAGPNRNPANPEGTLLLGHLAPHGCGGADFLEAWAQPATIPASETAATLQTDDLVVSLRGAGFRAAIVPEAAVGLALGTGLLRLRLRPDRPHGWRPRLLRWFLVHRAFTQHKHRWVDYRGLLMIRIGDLRALRLPVLAAPAGAAFEDLLETTASAERACREEILARRALTDAFLDSRLP